MSQKLRTASLLIALTCAIVCLPQRSLAQDAKIAVVNSEQMTTLSDEGKAANEKLDKRFQEIAAEMQKAEKEISEKENTLKTRDRLMSAAAKAQLSKEIADDKVKLDRKDMDYQKEMNEMQAELLSPIAAKAQAELQKVVSEMGYTLLLDLAAENGNIVWANPNNDISKVVIARMNETLKKEGSTGAAKPAAATPPKPAAAAPAGGTPRPAATTPTTPPR